MRDEFNLTRTHKSHHHFWDRTMTNNRHIECIQGAFSPQSENQDKNSFQNSESHLLKGDQIRLQDVSAASPCSQLIIDVGDLSNPNQHVAGIQRVAMHLLEELFRSPPAGYKIVPVFSQRGHLHFAHRFMQRFFPDMCQRPDHMRIEPSPGDLYLATDLNMFGDTQSLAKMVRFLRSRNTYIFFIIHDILPLFHRDFYPTGFATAFEDWLRGVAEHADGIIAVSTTTADAFISWVHNTGLQRCKGPQVNTIRLSNGLDLLEPLDRRDLKEFVPSQFPETFFLMVGSVQPRKGYLQTAQAFEMLWQRGFPAGLLVIGRALWGQTRFDLAQMRSNRSFAWLDDADDPLLAAAYEASAAVICASVAEGFGLPLVEAASFKKPIIARDIPVFREVAGENAFYFDGNTPQVLADAVMKWTELRVKNNVPTSEHIELSTWGECTASLCASMLRTAHWASK